MAKTMPKVVMTRRRSKNRENKENKGRGDLDKEDEVDDGGIRDEEY